MKTGRPSEDFTGQVMAGWTVVSKGEMVYGQRTPWICRHECGHEQGLIPSMLRVAEKNGTRIRCQGCKDGRHATRKQIAEEDLTGKRFGSLVVSGISGSYRYNKKAWSCSCDCGEVRILTSRELLSKLAMSCVSCSRNRTAVAARKRSRGRPFQDITGLTFGHWRAIRRLDQEYTDVPSGEIPWECVGECSHIHNFVPSSLKAGRGAKSCPTCFPQRRINFKIGDQSIEELGIRSHRDLNKIVPGSRFEKIRKGANHRGIEFQLDKIGIAKLLVEQDFTCALSGVRISTQDDGCAPASLDRKDSSKGYVYGNVQWVSLHVNIAKWDKAEEAFIAMCRAVVKHHEKIVDRPRASSASKLRRKAEAEGQGMLF